MKLVSAISAILLSLGLFTNHVNATSIYLDPGFRAISPGEEIGIRIFVSDLPEALGAFQFDISFDPLYVKPSRMVFATGLGDPVLEAVTFFDAVDIYTQRTGEVSLLTDFELFALQGETATGQIRNPLVLGEIFFKALNYGHADYPYESYLRLGNVALSNAFGVAFSDVSIGNGVILGLVPEPGSLPLLGLAFIGLVLVRKGKVQLT